MDANYFNELLANTQIATDALKKSLDGMEVMLGEALKNAPEQDKHKVAAMKGGIERAMTAAKNGDTNGIQDILKSFEQWQ
jgi:hypothetical protein